MQDAGLWRYLEERGYKKALIVQDDGFLLKRGIERFLEWDYVGAPWADTRANEYIKHNINPELVGNGGLSIRSVDKMREVCEKYVLEKRELFYANLTCIPEDVYFTKYVIKIGGKVAPNYIARYFAVEQVLEPTAIGIHKAWPYHTPEVFSRFVDAFFSS